jgi:hypothetical protein
MPDYGQPLSPQELQFQHAEPIAAPSPEGTAQSCVACRQPVGDSYYHAQGQTVCSLCAQRIQSGQQAPPAVSLLRAALYGGGAALGGCILYALVAIVLNLEIGIIAILVGWMVGKAIRHASDGLGGRPQQILAVALTYFAISTSYIPVMIYQVAKHPTAAMEKARTQEKEGAISSEGSGTRKSGVSGGALLFSFLLLIAIAPFLTLTAGVSGLISLFILFIGMQRAWRLTGRTDIVLSGPYQAEVPQ